MTLEKPSGMKGPHIQIGVDTPKEVSTRKLLDLEICSYTWQYF
jgi:hypothetical protein